MNVVDKQIFNGKQKEILHVNWWVNNHKYDYIMTDNRDRQPSPKVFVNYRSMPSPLSPISLVPEIPLSAWVPNQVNEIMRSIEAYTDVAGKLTGAKSTLHAWDTFGMSMSLRGGQGPYRPIILIWFKLLLQASTLADLSRSSTWTLSQLNANQRLVLSLLYTVTDIYDITGIMGKRSINRVKKKKRKQKRKKEKKNNVK